MHHSRTPDRSRPIPTVTTLWVPETVFTAVDLLNRHRPVPGMSTGGAAADRSNVLRASGLDGAVHPIRHHQGDRDPRPAPPTGRAATSVAAGHPGKYEPMFLPVDLPRPLTGSARRRTAVTDTRWIPAPSPAPPPPR